MKSILNSRLLVNGSSTTLLLYYAIQKLIEPTLKLIHLTNLFHLEEFSSKSESAVVSMKFVTLCGSDDSHDAAYAVLRYRRLS
jgi:hypothetical protein